MRHGRFEVLFVCTANQCRSPLAEHLLREALQSLGTPLTDWQIESAGTRGPAGMPMHPMAAEILAQRGIAVRDWRSRILDPELVGSADIILTASTEHRRHVVTMYPHSVQRTFRLLQFAELTADVEPIEFTTATEAGRQLAEQAVRARSRVQAPTDKFFDIADPVGRTRGDFRSCSEKIDRALNQILGPLRPSGG